MWKEAGVTAGFAIASALGLILGVLVPPLLPFALLGTVLGLMPALIAWTRRGLRRSRDLQASRTMGLTVLAAVAGRNRGHRRTVVEPRTARPISPAGGAADNRGGEIHGRGRPPGRPRATSGQRPALDVGCDARASAGRPPGPDQSRPSDRIAEIRWEQRWLGVHGLLRAVVRGLRARHWQLTEEDTEGIAFERERRVPIHSRAFPPETGNTVALPRAAVRDNRDGIPMKLRFSPDSRMILIAPPETFGPSFPTGMRRTHPVSDLEEITLPMTETGRVEVDVRAPLFRNELLGGFADVSTFAVIHGGLGLLLTALILLFNEEFRKRLQRLWNPRAETAATG